MALVYGLYYGLEARPLRHPVGVRGDLRLLLPHLPAVADVLGDPHLAQLELGHARGAGGGGTLTAPAEALRGAVAFLLLPLSLVPLYFAVPRLRSEVAPDPDRAPFAAPAVTPTEAQLQRWRPLPPARDAVPVLAYHGVNEKPDHYSVTDRQFAEQMEMLRRVGLRVDHRRAVRALPAGSHRQPAEAPDPDHVRRRAPGLVSRRGQDPRRGRHARDHVRDRRLHRGRQPLLPGLGRAEAHDEERPVGRAGARGHRPHERPLRRRGAQGPGLRLPPVHARARVSRASRSSRAACATTSCGRSAR